VTNVATYATNVTLRESDWRGVAFVAPTATYVTQELYALRPLNKRRAMWHKRHN